MLVPNQCFDVKITRKNIDYFQSLGYQVKLKDIINIPAHHLTHGSKQLVWVQCDVCHELYEKVYKQYLIDHSYDMDTCKHCKNIKAKKTCLNRYGVESPIQNPDIQEKIKQTNLEKYGIEWQIASEQTRNKILNSNINNFGVPYVSQHPDIKAKVKQTNMDRYGYECIFSDPIAKEQINQILIERYGSAYPIAGSITRQKIEQTNIERYGNKSTLPNKDVQEKKKRTNIEKYGCESPLGNAEIRAKIRDTMIMKYGVECVGKSLELQAKARETMQKHGTIKTSSQQIQLYNIIKQKYHDVDLNYPLSMCNLDIYLHIDGVNIDVEYDGAYWHQDLVKDIKRDKFLQSQGFKVLRIRSGHMIPSKEDLFAAIDELVNTDRIFKEIILSDWEQYKINE